NVTRLLEHANSDDFHCLAMVYNGGHAGRACDDAVASRKRLGENWDYSGSRIDGDVCIDKGGALIWKPGKRPGDIFLFRFVKIPLDAVSQGSEEEEDKKETEKLPSIEDLKSLALQRNARLKMEFSRYITVDDNAVDVALQRGESAYDFATVVAGYLMDIGIGAVLRLHPYENATSGWFEAVVDGAKSIMIT